MSDDIVVGAAVYRRDEGGRWYWERPDGTSWHSQAPHLLDEIERHRNAWEAHQEDIVEPLLAEIEQLRAELASFRRIETHSGKVYYVKVSQQGGNQ